MMFFVHPQIKFRDLPKVISAFFKKTDLRTLNKKLSSYFPGRQFIFTDMGRTAFRLIVEKLGLQDSEMLMPAYICDIFFPILKEYNIRPIFLDIDLTTFNVSLEQVKKKITPDTRVILISHTYSLAVDIERIRQISLQSSASSLQPPIIIEDCAHAFGVKIRGEYVGNFGDVAFFSLYKQFPSLRGGMLVCPDDWSVSLLPTYFNFRDFISLLNCFPLFAYLFKHFGSSVAFKMLRGEKKKKLAGLNRVSLNLFSAFFNNFKGQLKKRQQLALFFQEELRKLGFEVQKSENNVFCYLSGLVPKHLESRRDELVKRLRRYRLFCTRIWHHPLILNKEVQREYHIDLSQFPNTVEAAKRIINFPLQNYYTGKVLKKMIENIKKVIKYEMGGN